MNEKKLIIIIAMPNMRSMFDFYCVSSGWHSQFGDMKTAQSRSTKQQSHQMMCRDRKKKTKEKNKQTTLTYADGIEIKNANSMGKTHDAANHDDFSHDFTWIASSVEICS